MPVKKIDIPELGTVCLYKRSGVRTIRLTIGPDGKIRVTLPKWAPYKLGLDFVQARQDWLLTHRPAPQAMLQSGYHIGKAHRLLFIAGNTSAPRARITANEVIITHPSALAHTDAAVQRAALRAGTKALRMQAEQLLPIRVHQLAQQHGFSYNNIKIKQLKARWGSCNHMHELVFNLYLMQLSWPLIDYVILHELQHTTVLKHGPQFWQALSEHIDNVAELRAAIKYEQPLLRPQRHEI